MKPNAFRKTYKGAIFPAAYPKSGFFIQKWLHFTSNLAEAIHDAKIIFLALPTPPGGDGSADLSYVLGAAKDIAQLITDYKVIVTKSTVPVGTADKVTAIMKANTSVEFA